MKKQSIVDIVNELPREFDLDQLMERLIVIDKIDKGLNEVKSGKTISHESVKKVVAKWSK